MADNPIYKSPLSQAEEFRAEKISLDAGEYFNEGQLETLKKYCDRYGVDFESAKTELARRFDNIQKNHGLRGVDAASAAVETLTDDLVMGFNPQTFKNPAAQAQALRPQVNDNWDPKTNPYAGKSTGDLDKEGFEGWHNTLIQKLRNSSYDTYEDAIADLNRERDEPFDDKQKQYVTAYARQVFGMD